MQRAVTAARVPTGLIVTIAVHAGIALALISVTIISDAARPLPGPLIGRNIPIPPPPVQRDLVPEITNLPIRTDVDRPAIEIVDTPRADTTTTTVIDHSTATATGSGTATEADPIVAKPIAGPVGPTRRPMLDIRFMRDFEAPYPPASQRLGETGTVVVHVVIGTDGRVLSAAIAKTSGFARLDDAALKRALAKWRFIPALENGVAIVAERDVPVTFRLRG